MKNQKIRVVCALSGGVDSSVAAALLKKEGFDIRGIFMRLYSSSNFLEAEKRARKVAKILKIPFQVLNLEKEFKKKVIDYFLKEYQRGRTPNPCVVCNKEIKFGLLLKKILSLKADFIATGHYARIILNKKPQSYYSLITAKDEKKDQSYFLWQLNQKQLRHILFPLGDKTKEEVKGLAKKLKLPAWNIPESQEICFIQTTINDFLAHHLKSKSGPILTFDKKKEIGRHQGLIFYTIGQRKGINLPKGPYYVVKKHFKKNILYVLPFPFKKGLYQKSLIIEKINWISFQEPKLPLKIKAQIRYQHQLVPTKITRIKSKKKKYKVIFSLPQRAITPGQSVVFYQSKKGFKELLGGGIICEK